LKRNPRSVRDDTSLLAACGSSEFVIVLNLGEHALTGVFPASTDELISRGQLELL
jgi:hypothetical protein